MFHNNGSRFEQGQSIFRFIQGRFKLFCSGTLPVASSLRSKPRLSGILAPQRLASVVPAQKVMKGIGYTGCLLPNHQNLVASRVPVVHQCLVGLSQTQTPVVWVGEAMIGINCGHRFFLHPWTGARPGPTACLCLIPMLALLKWPWDQLSCQTWKPLFVAK